MSRFDVFNGDADGLCALLQLRLAEPADATLVTGVKRNIRLLQRVAARAGDRVTVLDISLDANRDALQALLARGVHVQYFDHHGSGDVPRHPLLQACIEPLPTTCTALLVDRWLHGAQRPWAVVGAFGDNMGAPARALGAALGLDEAQVDALRELGECLNYNAYGDSEADIHAHPAALYRLLLRRRDPFAFIASEPLFPTLRDARQADLAQAQRIAPYMVLPQGSIVVLPDARWSRRVRGEFGYHLARAAPLQAHAVLTPNAHGGHTVSVRAPLGAPHGADRLCRSFPGGGGRPAAAGINHLPRGALPRFVAAFARAFPAA